MKRQLRQFTLGVLLLAPVFGSLPVSAEDLREGTCAGAQEMFPDNNPGPGSLKALRPHRIPELDSYVRDRRAAVALGKALFWDMQVGSDGIQACGSCHFRAGDGEKEEDIGIGNQDPFGNPGALTGILTTLPAQIPSAELLTQPIVHHRQSGHRHRRANLNEILQDTHAAQRRTDCALLPQRRAGDAPAIGEFL